MGLAFESLSDKLQNIFKNLRGKGRLTEEDVKAALKEVRQPQQQRLPESLRLRARDLFL